MPDSISGQIIDSGVTYTPVLQGKSGELLGAQLHGTYYTQAARGNLFIGSTLIAGTAIPVVTTTAPTCFLWNPAGSGKNLSIIAFYAGFASGTGIAGQIGYAQLTGAGAAPVNTVITAMTMIAPSNALIGGGAGPVAKFGTTVTIVTTTVSFLRPSGISQGAPITSTAASWTMQDKIDGSIVVPPGNAIYPVASAAIAEVLAQAWVWEEVSI